MWVILSLRHQLVARNIRICKIVQCQKAMSLVFFACLGRGIDAFKRDTSVVSNAPTLIFLF